MQKLFFIIFNSFIISSSFVSAFYCGDIKKKDRRTIEACLSCMRQKYFEEQNFLENDIQVIPIGQKVKIVGLDKVTDHIDANIQASTNFQTDSLEILDEYCKRQNYEVTSHINQIFTGLKKKIPKQFDTKNEEDFRFVKKRLENLESQEYLELSKKNQKQTDVLISTALRSVAFFLFAVKAHEKDQNVLAGAIGVWYLKFLWDQGSSFYQEDLKFQEKLAEITLQNIACEAKKDELELNKEIKDIIQDELELFRKNKVEQLDKKLTEYRSQELTKISLAFLLKLKEREKFLRKKTMELRRTEMQQLFAQHQELKAKMLLEKKEEVNSLPITQQDKSGGNIVSTIFSKISDLFRF